MIAGSYRGMSWEWDCGTLRILQSPVHVKEATIGAWASRIALDVTTYRDNPADWANEDQELSYHAIYLHAVDVIRAWTKDAL